MKGQISVELLIIVIVLLGIFSAILATTTSREGEFLVTRTTLHAKEVADNVAFTINQVFLGGPGTTKEIVLPTTLRGNIPYRLNYSYSNHLLIINYSSSYYTAPLITGNISGDFPFPITPYLNITHEVFGVNISYRGGS